MKFYVVRQYRSVSRIHSEWWGFFSIPYVFSVWWKPDGTKTIEQYLDEQFKIAEEYLRANPTHQTSGPR
jgi:hypothetical protein